MLDDVVLQDATSLFLAQAREAVGNGGRLESHEVTALFHAVEAGRAAEAELSSGASHPDYRAELDELVALGREARDRLVLGNTGLVMMVAARYVGRGLSMDDMVQCGNIGLVRAVDRFDVHRGYRFSTYATHWIRHEITAGLREDSRTIRLPAYQHDRLVSVVLPTGHRLRQELGREPTDDELDAAVVALEGKPNVMPASQLVRRAGTLESLDDDAILEEDRRVCLVDDNPGPAALALESAARAAVLDAMATLPEREREVMELYTGLADGQARGIGEIGKHLGVTRQRAWQIYNRARRRLLHPSNLRRLADFA